MTCSRVGAIAGLTILMSGCDLIPDQTIEYPSPNGTARLVVATVGIKPQIRIRLKTGSKTNLLYQDDYPPREFYIRFSDVYWTADSRLVAVYVVSGDLAPIFLAVDIKRGTLSTRLRIKVLSLSRYHKTTGLAYWVGITRRLTRLLGPQRRRHLKPSPESGEADEAESVVRK
jgi:hypothetical protein